MSEKKRQKKDGRDTNKDNQRMRAANSDIDRDKGPGRSGDVKQRHKIDSVKEGYIEDHNGA
jgi:hypothetical protein